MTLYTDKQYYIDEAMRKVLDLYAERSTGNKKWDNLLIVDGDEGYGKSNFAIGCAYYYAWKTKRPFSVNSIFFDIEKLIDFTKRTKEQVIVWDEAALGGLATDWRNEFQMNLIKLLMTARKKRHFLIFCIPKFFKLNEYILVDRAIGLAHVYARRELEPGRFLYFKKRSKEMLYYDRIKTKMRNYKKHKDLHGSFPEVIPKLIDEVAYEKLKDEAIESIGSKRQSTLKIQKQLTSIKGRIAELLKKGLISRELLLDHFEISEKTYYNWLNKAKSLEE